MGIDSLPRLWYDVLPTRKAIVRYIAVAFILALTFVIIGVPLAIFLLMCYYFVKGN